MPENYTQPLPESIPVALCMIVKNEAATIAKTLRSAVEAGVGAIYVLDTGSTDGTLNELGKFAEREEETQDRVHFAMGTGAFVDFATTRNEAMRRCAAVFPGAQWILNLDADDVVQKPHKPLAELVAEIPPGVNGARVRMHMPATTFDSTRLCRVGAAWAYVGAVHEVLMGEGEIARITLDVDHVAGEVSQEASRKRWKRDEELLEAEVDKDPTNTRAWFYLGLTRAWLSNWNDSLGALKQRVSLGGWAEEVSYAQLQIARNYQAVAQQHTIILDQEISDAFLSSWATTPHRAEPLFELAFWYMSRGNVPLAYLYGKAAYDLPYPANDVLFIEDAVYRWRAADIVASTAYYVKQPAIGYRAAVQAALQCPKDHPDHTRIETNLGFYESLGLGPRIRGRTLVDVDKA